MCVFIVHSDVFNVCDFPGEAVVILVKKCLRWVIVLLFFPCDRVVRGVGGHFNYKTKTYTEKKVQPT